MSNLNLGHHGTTTSIAYNVNPNQRTHYDKVFTNKGDGSNAAVVAIGSRDRDYNLYNTTNTYKINLSKQYKEVTSIELVAADIPNTGYVVESTRNLIHFQDTIDQIATESYYEVELPIGNYPISADTGLSITKNIQDQMNAATTSGSVYEVSVDTYTNLITIEQTSGSEVFRLLFKGKEENYESGKKKTLYRKNTIGHLIGYERKDYTGELTYTGTYAYNLTIDNYLLMFVNDYSRIDSVNSNVQDAFCLIPLDTSINNFSYAKNCDYIRNDRYVKVFSEPLPELSKIEITFTDASGNLFNFNGHDHILMFEITTRTRTGRY
jgi:hypothetical protein